jgi:hypothetical protein
MIEENILYNAVEHFIGGMSSKQNRFIYVHSNFSLENHSFSNCTSTGSPVNLYTNYWFAQKTRRNILMLYKADLIIRISD